MYIMTTNIGKAHGKIILMGEHAVVYGEPSIALPFPAVEMIASVSAYEGPVRLDCSYYHASPMICRKFYKV